MTCHKTNLDIDITKLNGIEVRERVPEELHIPYTLIIRKGEEEKAAATLEKIIEKLRKKKPHHENNHSLAITACA